MKLQWCVKRWRLRCLKRVIGVQVCKKKKGAYEKYFEFKDTLLNAIYDNLTVGEFEHNWWAAIKEYELQDDKAFR